MVRLITSAYPSRELHDPEMYAMQASRLLAEYPMWAAKRAVDKIIRGCKFFPAIAEIAQALDAEHGSLAKQAQRVRKCWYNDVYVTPDEQEELLRLGLVDEGDVRAYRLGVEKYRTAPKYHFPDPAEVTAYDDDPPQRIRREGTTGGLRAIGDLRRRDEAAE